MMPIRDAHAGHTAGARCNSRGWMASSRKEWTRPVGSVQQSECYPCHELMPLGLAGGPGKFNRRARARGRWTGFGGAGALALAVACGRIGFQDLAGDGG